MFMAEQNNSALWMPWWQRGPQENAAHVPVSSFVNVVSYTQRL